MVEKSIEERVGTLEKTVDRLEGILDGTFGQKGLRQTVHEFLAKWESREEDKKTYDDRQEERSQRNNRLLMMILTIVLALAAVAGVAVSIFVYERTTHSRLLSGGNPAYASRQDAGLR
jgi:hypothetical protein